MAFSPPLLNVWCPPADLSFPWSSPEHFFFIAANAYSQDRCASAHSLNFQLSTHSSLLVLAWEDSSWLTGKQDETCSWIWTGWGCDLRAGEGCKPLTPAVLLRRQSLNTSTTLKQPWRTELASMSQGNTDGIPEGTAWPKGQHRVTTKKWNYHWSQPRLLPHHWWVLSDLPGIHFTL